MKKNDYIIFNWVEGNYMVYLNDVTEKEALEKFDKEVMEFTEDGGECDLELLQRIKCVNNIDGENYSSKRKSPTC